MAKQANPKPKGEMSLLEHLDELRRRLRMAIIALLIGTIIGAVFTEPAIGQLVEPAQAAGIDIQAIKPSDNLAAYFKVSLVIGTVLAMPMIVVDERGDLLYFNEAAEPIFGRRFDETGPLRRGEFTATFKPTDEDGTPIKREDQPLTIATDQQQPAHRRFWIQGMDGVARKIEGLACPLQGHGGRKLGAVAIFWEVQEP